MKRGIIKCEETTSKSSDFIDHIRLSLKELNKLIDSLPSYKGAGCFHEELITPFIDKINTFYIENLNIHKNTPITLSLANYKENRLKNTSVQESSLSLSSLHNMSTVITSNLPNFFDSKNTPSHTLLSPSILTNNFREILFPSYQPMSLSLKEIGKFSFYQEEEEG